MKKWKQIYKHDLARYYGSSIPRRVKYFLKLLRQCQFPSSKAMLLLSKIRLSFVKKQLSIEISEKVSIGSGFYINHPFCITINDEVIIGKNCNIHKGVTIGKENRGMRKGAPIIGDSVWIGVNSTIVGKITIGSDVLIAPNSFINQDIPPHSVVFGNPCIIKNKPNATLEYINNKI